VRIDVVPGYSTSRIVARMQERPASGTENR
jgi:hypothetical protein